MDVRIHGSFRISGESVPLSDSLRGHLRRRLLLALSQTHVHAAWIQVLVHEAFSASGCIQHQCQINAWLGRQAHLIAEDGGNTPRQAIDRTLDRLTHDLRTTPALAS